MIRIENIPAQAAAPASVAWPGQAAFEAAPHIRIDGGAPIRWQTFVEANDALDPEEVADIWHALAATGEARVGGGAAPEFVITGCGKPGATVHALPADRANTPAGARRRQPMVYLADLLAAHRLSIGLGTLEAMLGGVRLTPSANGRSLIGRHFPGEARR